MRLPIERKHVKVYPDPKRVIARFFFNGDERGREVINKVMTLTDEQVFNIISPLCRNILNDTVTLLRFYQGIAKN